MTMASIEPEAVAILGIELYFPRNFVEQSELGKRESKELKEYFADNYACLEEFDGIQEGKYTIGLGQQRMTVPSAAEDCVSMAMTAFSRLLTRHSINPSQIGRLEVGSESNPDRAKSVKSHLMSLLRNSLAEFGAVAGSDCVQACYGGSAAYLNALAWLSSPFCGKERPLAVVIASDVAVYAPGPARATGGAAAVAILLSRVPASQAAIRCDLKPIGHAAADVYDFYKAEAGSEYPQVDGPLSVDCYLRSVEAAIRDYGLEAGVSDGLRDDLGIPCSPAPDVLLFHTPFSKIAHKALKRLPVSEEAEEASLKCLQLTSLLGNSYCASLYVNLLYFLTTQLMDTYDGAVKRVLMVSYGSGLMASSFGICVRGDLLDEHCSWLPQVSEQLNTDLHDRLRVSAHEFTRMLQEREDQFKEPRGWMISGEMLKGVRKGAYYLHSIDERFRRRYLQKP